MHRFYVFIFFIFTGLGTVFSQTGASLNFFPDNPLSAGLNPAKLYGKGTYFSIPVISSLNFSLYSSTISYNDFIAKDPLKKDSLLINKDVLNKLGADNMIFTEIRKPLLMFGWGNETNSFEVQFGMHGYTRFDFSKNMVSLLLEGNEKFIGKKINFDKEKVEANAYGEFSLGYSHKISDRFFIGGRIKGLLGLTNIHTKSMNFSMQTDNESFKTNLYSDIILQTALPGNFFKNKGLAADLGIVYKIPEKGIEYSASVIDVGFIHWKEKVISYLSSTNGKVFEFKGITGLYSQSLQEITDSLQNQLEFTSVSGGSYTSFLPVKLVLAFSYCPHQRGCAGIMYMRNFGKNFTSIAYTFPVTAWLRVSASNSIHSGRFVNPGFGFEAGKNSFQCFGVMENIDSFWLHRTKNISVSMGMHIFLYRGKQAAGTPLIGNSE
jgi:hypothetical protein